MLINGWSGSGGDAFPFYFREAGLGPLIGTRTWGGLIGISGAPSLVDGGGDHGSDLPDVRPEGHLVRRRPRRRSRHSGRGQSAQLAKGTDPQLQRAIEEINKRIASAPKPPAQPAYEKRTP